MTLLVLGEWCISFRVVFLTRCFSLGFGDSADLMTL